MLYAFGMKKKRNATITRVFSDVWNIGLAAINNFVFIHCLYGISKELFE